MPAICSMMTWSSHKCCLALLPVCHQAAGLSECALPRGCDFALALALHLPRQLPSGLAANAHPAYSCLKKMHSCLRKMHSCLKKMHNCLKKMRSCLKKMNDASSREQLTWQPPGCPQHPGSCTLEASQPAPACPAWPWLLHSACLPCLLGMPPCGPHAAQGRPCQVDLYPYPVHDNQC